MNGKEQKKKKKKVSSRLAPSFEHEYYIGGIMCTYMCIRTCLFCNRFQTFFFARPPIDTWTAARIRKLAPSLVKNYRNDFRKHEYSKRYICTCTYVHSYSSDSDIVRRIDNRRWYFVRLLREAINHK